MMGKDTDIEYADSTLNLEMGCDGCELWLPESGIKDCYAGVLTERYGGVNKGFPAKFEEPKLFVERLDTALRWSDLTGKDRPDKPWLNGLPRIVFLNDMGDTFTESLPIDWLAPLLPRIADSPHHYLLLTKRPSRMAEFSKEHPLPPNVWPGASVTSAKTLSRTGKLGEVCGGGPKWLSVEPMLGPIQFAHWLWYDDEYQASRFVDWIVGGGPSGATAKPPHPYWSRSLRDQSIAAGAAFFWKQHGEWAPLDLGHGRVGDTVVYPDGTTQPYPTDRVIQAHGYAMRRVGKHAAGRLIDGREWSEMPRLEVHHGI